MDAVNIPESNFRFNSISFARIIGVTTDTITAWELNRFKPNKKYHKKIGSFIS